MDHRDMPKRPRRERTPATMTRSDAARVLDSINKIVSEAIEGELPNADALLRVRAVLAENGVTPLRKCTGEAHSNAFIDNCSVCMPRWGWCGPKVTVG